VFWNTNSNQWEVGNTSVHLGANAGYLQQSPLGTVAIGENAGYDGQVTLAVAIGSSAGYDVQEESAIAIGTNAGYYNQQKDAIAIGTSAGRNSSQIGNTGEGHITIGFEAGKWGQLEHAIAIGYQAADGDDVTNQDDVQLEDTIAIGTKAARRRQKASAIAIGSSAGVDDQGEKAIAIGYEAGLNNQKGNAVAIGTSAGQNASLDLSDAVKQIAIGFEAGKYSQAEDSIAIGTNAADGYNSNSPDVSIGQGANCVAIGEKAGRYDQHNNAIAIGGQAGCRSQDEKTVAIGFQAAFEGQHAKAIAVGYEAGYVQQGVQAIAIGERAGYGVQGDNSIMIGYGAGDSGGPSNGAAPNSIMLNASGSQKVATDPGFYVFDVQPKEPPDAATELTNVVQYNVDNDGQITYCTTKTVKTFVIDHPVDPDRYLVHACLEGPESGVYYRGESELKDGEIWIELPPYVSRLAHNLTVQLTQINSSRDDAFARLRAGHVTGQGFTVYGDACQFAWHVFGTRNDIQTEPLRTDVVVQGDGPYRYIR
jgi:hypothetical protein